MKNFFIGFEKNAAAKWQQMLPSLSQKAKARLRRYAGSGLTDVAKAREGMFTPKYDPEKLKRTTKMDKKIYQQFHKHDPSVRRAGPEAKYYYAQYVPGRTPKGKPHGYINLPAYGKEAPSERFGRGGGASTQRRAILEHEKQELRSETEKFKRKNKHPVLGKQKSIMENPDVIHAGPTPLIAEANIAGRHPNVLKQTIKEWSQTPAQGTAYKHLKNVGWTPSRGMPAEGRQAEKFIGKVQGEFAPFARKSLEGQIAKIKGRYKGRVQGQKIEEAKRYFKEFAK